MDGDSARLAKVCFYSMPFVDKRDGRAQRPRLFGGLIHTADDVAQITWFKPGAMEVVKQVVEARMRGLFLLPDRFT